MSLQNDIRGQIKEAMLAKDALRLAVVRGLVAAFTNELVAKQRKPTEELSDEDVLSVIRRAVKQRKDSIEQFTAGGRQDLVDSEAAELSVLEKYLPQMMSRDEIKKVAEAKKAELGITDKTKLGQFVGALMKELKGKADGADVKAVAESMF
ncbi:MAG: GatB/Yqey domain superfamily [Parcubacteria group bacterium GW2011_GWA2_47_16]|nr:MAG: GatB/Yqey domain superfamily [Parcubacteria group bacterium GW2011_GWA2_47_16]